MTGCREWYPHKTGRTRPEKKTDRTDQTGRLTYKDIYCILPKEGERQDMKPYRQMTGTDRIRMEALLDAGHSKAEVARMLHFHRSTFLFPFYRKVFVRQLQENTVVDVAVQGAHA